MAANLAHENRVRSILSTLDILDGDRRGRNGGKARKRKGSLRSHTLASVSKTRDSISDYKELKMVPRMRSESGFHVPGSSCSKHTEYLSRVVRGPRGEVRGGSHTVEVVGGGGEAAFSVKIVGDIDQRSNIGMAHSLPPLSDKPFAIRIEDGDVSAMPSRNLTRSNNGVERPDASRKLPSRQKSEDGERPGSLNGDGGGGGGGLPVGAAMKWKRLAKSRLRQKPPKMLSTATLAEVVKAKGKGRRSGKSLAELDSSSAVDSEESPDKIHKHITTLQVINATVAFKRQRLKKIREKRKFRVSRLFPLVSRLIILIRRICAVHYVESSEDRAAVSFVRMVSDRHHEDLMFDVTDYKAKKKWRLMAETKRILQKPTFCRTEQDIQHIELALKDLSTLGEYPAAMQRSIARVGWYEAYGSNRVLVREGHTPDAFYFILSGSIVVSESAPRPRILAILLRGDSFGELAILNQSKRTSTVTSRESVEMFVISSEDFMKIVMSGNTKMLQEPGTVAFMRSVHFLKEWPLQKIENHPKKCVFNFFRKDTVLVRDSKLSEWIYVVKSGSCSVLKQVAYVEPELYAAQQKSNCNTTPCKHDKQLLERERSFVGRRVAAARAHRESLYHRGMDLPYLMLNEELAEQMVTTRKRSGSILQDDDGKEDFEEEKQEEKWMEQLEESGALTDITEKLYPLVEEEDDDYDDDSPRYGPQRTFADDLNQRAKARKRLRELGGATADRRKVFLCIQTLEKGGVFGLVDVLFSEQPSLSLVSNGAECMVMSKQFFLQHSTDDMLHRTKISMMPFAKDDEFQRSLENQLRWDAYRSHTMQKTLRRMQMKKFYSASDLSERVILANRK